MSSPQWTDAIQDLCAWHANKDGDALSRSLSFIERALRSKIRLAAFRRWSSEQIDEALQGLLVRLMTKPLPDGMISHPAAYIHQAFRNRCLDVERGRQRHPSDSWDDNFSPPSPPADHAMKAEAKATLQALAGLRMEYRVAIKLEAAPEQLDDEEWRWLAERCGRTPEAVRAVALSRCSVFELTLLFDPGDPPTDPKERRDRMERYRKRRERARAALRTLLGERA